MCLLGCPVLETCTHLTVHPQHVIRQPGNSLAGHLELLRRKQPHFFLPGLRRGVVSARRMPFPLYTDGGLSWMMLAAA